MIEVIYKRFRAFRPSSKTKEDGKKISFGIIKWFSNWKSNWSHLKNLYLPLFILNVRFDCIKIVPYFKGYVLIKLYILHAIRHFLNKVYINFLKIYNLNYLFILKKNSKKEENFIFLVRFEIKYFNQNNNQN